MNRSSDTKALEFFSNLPNDLAIPDEPHVELDAPDSDSEIVTNMNQSFAMKQRLYEKVLAPQLEKNEELKRDHKSRLMDNIFSLLKGQFRITYIFIVAVLIIALFSSQINLSDKLITEILSFVKFYVTSIIVELIPILFFIVKNVFDISIVDLFKNFDKDKKDFSS